MERGALSDPRLLGLPVGAWITAGVGIAATVILYRRRKVDEAVEETPSPVTPTGNEALAYQAASGYALGGGFGGGSTQVGEGEVGRRKEVPSPTPTPVPVPITKGPSIPPGQTPPIINPTTNPIITREKAPTPARTPIPIINKEAFEPGWIVEHPHPIEDTAVIKSESKSTVVNGGGPPRKTQPELVVF